MKFILYKQPLFSVKRYLLGINLLIIFFITSNCTPEKKPNKANKVSEINIVPNPSKILYKRGHFKLNKSTRILLNLSNDNAKIAGEYLLKEILKKTNYKLRIADRFTTTEINSGIEIIVGQYHNIKPEGFKIVISSNRIKILSNDSNGLFYASNVILDLLIKIDNGWNAAQVSIEDHPKTKIRGLYLNIQDSILDKPSLIKLLKKNRINYLISSENWDSLNGSILKINDTSLLSVNWKQNLIKEKNIKKFYLSTKHSDEIVLFNINDMSLLHPDSLSILGEAMWSKPNKLNYQKLVNHLKLKSED